MSIEEHLLLVSELLKSGITFEAAYCLGYATHLGFMRNGDYPPREVVEAFARCRTVEEGARLYVAFSGPPN